MGMTEILAQAENVKPIAEVNGTKIVTFDDQNAVAAKELTDGEDLGVRTLNPAGSMTPVARSRTPYASVNTETLYINRYKVLKKQMYVVTDYRAIKEQATGQVYLTQIPAHVFSRDAEGNLKLDKVVTVSDDDFVANFTKTLGEGAMREIFDLIGTQTIEQSEELPI